MTRMLDGISQGRLDETADFLSRELDRLAAAGADFALLASNTPHIVFDRLRQRSRIPLISIVETACDAAEKLNLETVGLFGTKFTMLSDFYPKVFGRRGIEVLTPSESQQDYIHEKYMNELVKGMVLDKTKAELIKIAAEMRDAKRIQGLILGGTELPLILRSTDEIGIPILDTTEIHVARILEALCEPG
jgi:aspartate racemase